jgi:hypothetical protein
MAKITPGAAHADLAEHRLDGLERADLIGQRARERVELLTQRHGDGILQLRSPHLENVRELFALRSERRDQLVQRADDLGIAECHANVHGGRVGVVRGLSDSRDRADHSTCIRPSCDP